MKNLIILLVILIGLIACEQTNNPIEELEPKEASMPEDTINEKTLNVPIAYFKTNRKYATINDTVYFTNMSQSDSLSFIWYFGDGSTSTEIEPFHIYTELGAYKVSLVAINSAGKDSLALYDSIYIQHLVDYEGNSYKTVVINGQEWMAENIRSTVYPDGAEIPLVEGNGPWHFLGNDLSEETEAYCYYENTPNAEKGALYTYTAAMKVCPYGWRIPSQADYDTLSFFIAADQGIPNYEVALHLKSKTGWCDDTDGYKAKQGLDTYGLNFLPTGRRSYYQGSWEESNCICGFYRFSDIKHYNDVGPSGIENTNMSYSVRFISRGNWAWSEHGVALTDGVAIRCMRDVEGN